VRQIAAEIAASQTGDEPARLEQLFALDLGHATPKVAVRGVVARGDKVLLVRNLDDGGWSLPGGWCEVGESPSGAVEKEVLEESGFTTRAIKVLAIENRDLRTRPVHPTHVYVLVFLCEVVSEGEPDGLETVEAGFFGPNELPPLSPRETRARIEKVFEHVRDPALPAEFD
jgi:ADP-ribose pyrophosphatase YjhB (NUDIX family)